MTITAPRLTMQTPAHNSLRGELRSIAPSTRSNTPRQYWAGLAWQLGSAAFWESAASAVEAPASFKLGGSLLEELGVCLLGGFGVPFELGNAAFEQLRAEGVFADSGRWTPEQVEELLLVPLSVRGRQRRYRFPRQRAARIVAGIDHLRDNEAPADDVELRDWLTRIVGVGPKTASWVVRNNRSSDQVAIIDIHIARAGTVAGVFDPDWVLPRDYLEFENAFLQWAAHAGLRAAMLDACIWSRMARSERDAHDILGVRNYSETLLPVWDVRDTQTEPSKLSISV